MLRTLIATAAISALGFGLVPTASAEPQRLGPAPTSPHFGFGPRPPASPLSQQNAVQKAKDYLNYSAFSRTGLIEQLEYSGFSTDDATYAVDSLNVDWNQQAAKKAKDYLNYSAFSRSGLIDQLEYSGFTPSQALFGVTAVGY
ncbi:Ltp family lipoprotein [Mycobacterium sp. NBC_00419]|uniref:Ltp family lipoprotein n=1 Tax=Mycobacterium sp. NBC_00419 TaxID=2975989 RepID=UPI002E1CF9FC